MVRKCGTTGNCPGRMLKKFIQQGRRRVETEAYPLGYVEDFDEPRTKLADFFSILLEARRILACGCRPLKAKCRTHLARIIHERFCCNREDGSQNPLRYSFFAPRSCKGRSTSQARWRRTWTRSAQRPGRRARCSVGQHTVSSMPPSLMGSALKPASPTLTRGPAPL